MSQIGLPETWRVCIFNQTGITVSNKSGGSETPPTVSGRRVRFDSTGTLSFEAASFTFFSVTSLSNNNNIGNNSYVVGSTWSNTVSGWLGGEFSISVGTLSNASGNVTVYLETSVDGGTTWPSPASANGAGGGIILAVVGFASTATASTASTTRIVAFEL